MAQRTDYRLDSWNGQGSLLNPLSSTEQKIMEVLLVIYSGLDFVAGSNSMYLLHHSSEIETQNIRKASNFG